MEMHSGSTNPLNFQNEIILPRFFKNDLAKILQPNKIQILPTTATQLWLPKSHRQELTQFWGLPPITFSKRAEPTMSLNDTSKYQRLPFQQKQQQQGQCQEEVRSLL
jgi:hypothetical protein